MPKISELPADSAPEGADLIPFVDTTASRTEHVTLTNLAASAAFAGAYQPLDADLTTLADGDLPTNLETTLDAVYAPLTGSAVYATLRNSVFLSPTRFGVTVSTPTPPTAGTDDDPSGWIIWTFSASLTQEIATILHVGTDIPAHWVTFQVDAVWYNLGAADGDVRWAIRDMAADSKSAGDTAAVTSAVILTTAAAGAQYVITETTLGTVTVPGEDYIPFSVQRAGAAAADTQTTTVGLLGVLLTRLT